MHQRCASRDNPHYGARGIAVCDRWSCFENFLADMGERPEGMTLERRDNNKGYEPDNCRWATRREQQSNRRSAHRITIGAETKSLYDWCRDHGLDPGTVRHRVRAFGWSYEKAILTPKMRDRRSAFEGGQHAQLARL